MKSMFILLSVFLIFNWGCKSNIIPTKDILSIEVKRRIEPNLYGPTFVITDQHTIENISNYVNNSHKELCIFRSHFEIYFNYKEKTESISILGKYFNIKGITFAMDKNLEDELIKLEVQKQK
jgi:hypothetical protein